MKNSIEIRCPFLDIEIINIIPKKNFLLNNLFLNNLLIKIFLKLLITKKKLVFMFHLIIFISRIKKGLIIL